MARDVTAGFEPTPAGCLADRVVDPCGNTTLRERASKRLNSPSQRGLFSYPTRRSQRRYSSATASALAWPLWQVSGGNSLSAAENSPTIVWLSGAIREVSGGKAGLFLEEPKFVPSKTRDVFEFSASRYAGVLAKKTIGALEKSSDLGRRPSAAKALRFPAACATRVICLGNVRSKNSNGGME